MTDTGNSETSDDHLSAHTPSGNRVPVIVTGENGPKDDIGVPWAVPFFTRVIFEKRLSRALWTIRQYSVLHGGIT